MTRNYGQFTLAARSRVAAGSARALRLACASGDVDRRGSFFFTSKLMMGPRNFLACEHIGQLQRGRLVTGFMRTEALAICEESGNGFFLGACLGEFQV